MAVAPPCDGLSRLEGLDGALAYNPVRDGRHSPPRPRPLRAPRLRPVRRDARRCWPRSWPTGPPRTWPRPTLVERDIETGPGTGSARYFASIPVVELGDRRLELATSLAKLRAAARRRAGRVTADDRHRPDDPGRPRRRRDQLPVALRPAARAGLPRPAHGDRGRVVGGRARRRRAGRRCATPSRTSPGFGAVFTLLGVTATFLAGPLVDYLAPLRTIGGVILVVLGPEPRRHPADPRRSNGRGGRSMPAPPGPSRPPPARSRSRARAPTGRRTADRLGGRLVSSRGGWLASFGLGAIFAVGWTPCIGIILGGILTMAATSTTDPPGHGPAGRLHARPRAPVPRDRARLRPGARPDPAADPPRAGRVAHRRPARRLHRRRDDLRLAGAACRASSTSTRPSSLTERPGFTHKRERHGLVGPFSGRQLLAAFVAHRPRGRRARRRHDAARDHRGDAPHRPARDAVPDRATHRRAPAGQPGAGAGRRARGRRHVPAHRPRRQADPTRRPAGQGRLAQLLGELVPALPARDADPARRCPSAIATAGSRSSGSASRRRRPADIAAYADRYQLPYTIGFDASGHVFHAYKVYALPTQFFIDPQGVIRQVVNGPVDEAGAAALIESMLPPAASPTQ